VADQFEKLRCRDEMSDLTNAEKRKLERLLSMGGGYVLDFSNRTFSEFISDATGREIYDPRYEYGSGSKANRLRAFWREEGNHVVGKLIGELLDYGLAAGSFEKNDTVLDECRQIVIRLTQNSLVPELDALTALTSERDFEAVAKEVRDAIEKNQPERGLDRLHTFVVKYVRALCTGRGIAVTREKPLHSLFGEYVRSSKDRGYIESEMTERILKSSISTLDAFNSVRNEQSLAHDNPILNYDEGLLIFNHVASSIRFLRSLESRAKVRERLATESAPYDEEEIPF
jgi:hypothetical protein